MKQDGPPAGARIFRGADPARHPTRGLTEGAVLAALTVLVGAAGLIAPPVGVLLAPIPVMLLVIRWGLRIALIASAVAALILLQFFGPLSAFSVTSMFAPLGLALGWGIRRGIGAPLTVLTGSVAFLGSVLIGVAVTNIVLHLDILRDLIDAQVKGIDMALALQARMGVPPQQLDEMRQLWDGVCAEHHCLPAAMPQFLHTLAPAMLVLGAPLWAYLCYTVARSVLRRVGYELPGVPAILSWRLPPAWTAGLLWTCAGLSLASRLISPWFDGPAVNAVYLVLIIFAFLGTLVAITWMNQRQIPRVAQIAALVLLLPSGLLPLLALAAVGILDAWYDYRHLASRGAEEAATSGNPPRAKDRPQVKAVHSR